MYKGEMEHPNSEDIRRICEAVGVDVFAYGDLISKALIVFSRFFKVSPADIDVEARFVCDLRWPRWKDADPNALIFALSDLGVHVSDNDANKLAVVRDVSVGSWLRKLTESSFVDENGLQYWWSEKQGAKRSDP